MSDRALLPSIAAGAHADPVTKNSPRSSRARTDHLRQYSASGVRPDPTRPVYAIPAAYSSAAHCPL